MVAPPCPHCHGATRFAGNKPYCPNCGWNRDAALADVRGTLVMLPFGIFLMGGFVFFMIRFWHFRNPYQIGIFVVFPAVGILINYFVSRRSLASAFMTPATKLKPKSGPLVAVFIQRWIKIPWYSSSSIGYPGTARVTT